MKRSTLIFGLIFALIFGYVWFVERKHPPHAAKDFQERSKIFDFQAGDIQTLELAKKHQTLRVERNGPASWELKSPIEDWADADQCNALATSLAGLTPMTSVSKKENIAAYGLGNQSVSLKAILKSGAYFELRIGNDDPTRSGTYAYVPAQGRLVLIPLSFGQTVTRPLETWRDHAILHFANEKLTKVEIQSKERTLRFEKSGTFWNLTSPARAKADSGKLAQVLNSLNLGRLSSFAPPRKPATPGTPLIRVALQETGNRPPEAITISSKTAQGYPAETSGRSAIFFVPASTVDEIRTDPAWYKDRHLLSFNEAELTKVEITHGDKRLVFERNKGEWNPSEPKDGKTEGWKAGMILSDLANLQEKAFAAPPASIAKPLAAIRLWKGNDLVAVISVGTKTKQSKESAYPVQIGPEKKQAWTDAGLLLKDLP